VRDDAEGTPGIAAGRASSHDRSVRARVVGRVPDWAVAVVAVHYGRVGAADLLESGRAAVKVEVLGPDGDFVEALARADFSGLEVAADVGGPALLVAVLGRVPAPASITRVRGAPDVSVDEAGGNGATGSAVLLGG
jgi:hypothetical protein